MHEYEVKAWITVRATDKQMAEDEVMATYGAPVPGFEFTVADVERTDVGFPGDFI